MKKMTVVEMLKSEGFVSSTIEGIQREHVFLTKTFEKDVEVVWHGTMKTTLKVDVFVNIESGICHATFYKDAHRAYKDRWYDTIGKRTFNAISETVKNAGFEL